MKMQELIFATGTVEEDKIFQHLIECEKDFTPALSTKVNLREYSQKINEKAMTFEAWS